MSFYISITNADRTAVWEKQGAMQDYREIVKLSREDKDRRLDLYESLIVPVHTNTLSHFVKDLFIPTTTHWHDIKAKNGVLPFSMRRALILDIATLFLRLITCIPRVIYNAYQEKHPLHKYLVRQDADSRILEANRVRVRCLGISDGYACDEGRSFKGTMHTFERTVNLTETHCYAGASDLLPFVITSKWDVSIIRSQAKGIGFANPDEVAAYVTPKSQETIEVDQDNHFN